ncbi:acetyl-CoA carboxylase [Mycena rosella]|uniref:Acetyl-CoA carboxylase n=1 Tax=Mycena rosella TaxID=1033263 RepID=A0AAD7D061_MYCRO|nr:acetyl-CoA carboxylase [Mycena rosella]
MSGYDHSKVQQFIGGNSLDKASSGSVQAFVKANGGHTVITKVLIANNGIAAVKEIRSIRQWSYETFGREREVEFTVMATPEDLKVNAEYIRMADRYIEVPGGSNNNNYANVDLIVDVAERSGVHAVWAGWGHASENPRLPESLAASKNKIVFIGPPGSAMRSLGDKISSTIVAQSANVPTMPWSGTGITDTDFSDAGYVIVPDKAYQEACVTSVEQGLQKAEEIGWPIMIKASEGGGGKGIRKVEKAEAFKNAYHAVAGEIPGSPIFIMKLAGQARHLEVQLLADQYGNAISLFGRDCSVQRRHQKIIEEAPVTIAGEAIFEQMERAAVRLAKLVGYVSAGTVEYLYNRAEDDFYFLELNPRLQVEHPTTEMVSGVNLPAAQLQIAMGIPMHRIKDIRQLYGVALNASSEIDFDLVKPDSQRKPRPKGHVVAVRITAENPDAGFKPSSGSIQELNFRSSTNVWGYFSVTTSGGLHEFADSQFGHIFAYGEDRGESRKNMIVALKELSIRGDFRHTVEYLIKLLELEAFRNNTITTGWLDSLISNKLTAERPDATLAVVCGAVTKAYLASEACWTEYKQILDKGQVPARDILKTVFGVDFIYENVRYSFTAARSSMNVWTLYLNGGRTMVGARPLADGGLLVLLDGRSHSIYWREEVGAMRLMVDAKTCLIEQENDPTQLRSPSPGKLIRYFLDSGDHINAGEQYAEIEVMKMYMPLVASEDGTLQLIKQPGVSLAPGDILGILTLDDPTRVKHAKPFEGLLPPMGAPGVVGNKPHQRLARCMNTLEDILDGFDNQAVMTSTFKDLIDVLHEPDLPYSETTAILSSLSGRMPGKLEESIRSAIDVAKGKEFPAVRIKKLLEHYVQDNVLPQDRTMFRAQLAPVFDVLDRFSGGLKGHEQQTISTLLERYDATEKLFGGSIETRILALRDQHKDDLDKVVALVLSHIKAQSKAKLVLAILDYVKTSGLNVSNAESRLYKVMQNLAALESKSSINVSLKAREVLILGQMPSYEERLVQMESILKAAVSNTHYGEQGHGPRTPSSDVLKELSDSRYTVYDVLPAFFNHEDPLVTLAAFEVYIRRAYRVYTLLSVDYEEGDTLDDGEVPNVVNWRFNLGQSHSPPSTPRLELEPPKRSGSVSDLSYMINRHQSQPVRTGAIASFPTLAALSRGFSKVAATLPAFDPAEHRRRHGNNIQPPNVMNIALRIFNDADDMSQDAWSEKLTAFSNEHSETLTRRGVRRISFLICRRGHYPVYFTLRATNGTWGEEQAIRNIEPALAFQLELSRLSKYNLKPCFVETKQIHIYHAVSQENQLDNRFFVRALVRPGRLRGSMSTAEYLISETDRLVTSVLDALEIVTAEHRHADCNHIFMNFVYNLAVTYEDVLAAISGFIDRHGKRLWRLHVTGSEIRIALEDDEGNVTPIRCTIDNVSGFIVNYHGYQEITTDRGTILKSIGDKGPLHLEPAHQPYPTKESLQPKRYQAHLIGTTYVYDFPGLFSKALNNVWVKARVTDPSLVMPKVFLSSKELVLDENDQLVEVDRAPGNNTFGMVAWVFTLRTPEYPLGRKVVVVANDITYKIGSFGPVEDQFFFLVTQYARNLGLPRIYLSANSGARIGLAEEALPLFSAAWNDDDHPEKGIKYLYLTRENFLKLEEKGGDSVRTVEIDVDGERRHKITDVIGLQDGLGVESLKGSGLIAGETSRAYDDIFTITLVTARSVGIGAYLVRLGERAVQVEGQPIILTGAPALNKVLGREVYTSNLQLGGTQIMFKNGVSHLTASSDLQGATHILEWISYVPEVKNGPLPVRETADPWDRDIGYTPPKGAYDPRWFIEGKMDENSSAWTSGFFDKGSFQETLSGWAQTVVVGRARLGGIPMGVIAVETRTIERVVPADPANAASFEQHIMEAGQVWYPNSAYKTAQAIFDFNREGLPLIIFANWRGFSGGQQDMYDEVLKQGSKIVDGLSSYKQPVFVYIVPNGELRGGAWVVLDPSINPEQMEMYADVEARAGVLEAEGIIEIKMRRDKIVKLMERLDSTYASLKRNSNDASKTPEERAAASSALASRETFLQPTYKQIALLYADLHDRTGRMEAKGCAKPAVWKDARRYFYWAVRSRVARSAALADIAEASPGTKPEYRSRLLNSLALIDASTSPRLVAEKLEKLDLSQTIVQLRTEHLMRNLLELTREDRKAAMDGLLRFADNLSDEERGSLLTVLQSTARPPAPPSYANSSA